MAQQRLLTFAPLLLVAACAGPGTGAAPAMAPDQQLAAAAAVIDLVGAEYLASLEGGDADELARAAADVDTLRELLLIALDDYLRDGVLGDGQAVLAAAQVVHDGYLAKLAARPGIEPARRAAAERRAGSVLQLLRAIWPASPPPPAPPPE